MSKNENVPMNNKEDITNIMKSPQFKPYGVKSRSKVTKINRCQA